MQSRTVHGWAAAALFVITGGLGTYASLVVIDAGEVGVEVLFGKVQGSLHEGLNLKNPFSRVARFPIRPQESTWTSTIDEGEEDRPDAIQVFALDNVVLTVDMTALWRLDSAMLTSLYRSQARNVGEVREIFVRPTARSVTRDCFADYNFEEARTTEREAIANCIRDLLNRELNPRGIIFDEVLIRQPVASEAVQGSIEAKAVAEQAVQEAEFRRQQALKDKATIEINADAEAQRLTREASGKAAANDTEGSSLQRNPILVQLRIIEALSDKAVVLLPEGIDVQPLIQLPTGDVLSPAPAPSDGG